MRSFAVRAGQILGALFLLIIVLVGFNAVRSDIPSLPGLVHQDLGPVLMTVGLVLGVAAAFALGPALAASLFGVSARNPTVYAATVGVLLLAGALACLVPALNAMKVDPTSS